jgi:hypothetical protein
LFGGGVFDRVSAPCQYNGSDRHKAFTITTCLSLIRKLLSRIWENFVEHVDNTTINESFCINLYTVISSNPGSYKNHGGLLEQTVNGKMLSFGSWPHNLHDVSMPKSMVKTHTVQIRGKFWSIPILPKYWNVQLINWFMNSHVECMPTRTLDSNHTYHYEYA